MESVVEVVERRFIYYEEIRNKISTTLQSIGVSTLDDKGNYKDISNILEEVSKVVKDFEYENFKDRKEIINMEAIWKDYYKQAINELEDKIKNRCMIIINVCHVLTGVRRSEELFNYLKRP